MCTTFSTLSKRIFFFFVLLAQWHCQFRILSETIHNCNQTQSQLLFDTPNVGAIYEDG